MPTTYLRASVSLLFHWQKQLSKFTVCYGDHLHTHTHTPQRRASRRQNTGDFLQDGAVAAARRACVLDAHPEKQGGGGDKSPSPGGRWREEEGWRISELPGVGALLDLDNCLQRSLDTSRQMPLPIKHSVARSFTP